MNVKEYLIRYLFSTTKKYATYLSFLSLSICCFLYAQEKPEHPIVVENRHIVAELLGGRLYITDAAIANVLLADTGVSALILSIPTGYQDFEILNGLNPDSLLFKENRIVDTRKLKRGKMPVAFRYALPVKKNKTKLSFSVYQPTSVFYFLMKNPELSVTSEQLMDEGLIDMGDHNYRTLSGVSFAAGESFSVTISGLAKQTRRKNVLIFASIVFIVLSIIAAFVFRRGRVEDPKAHDKHLEEKKKILISIIALLDEKYESGEVGETVYHELRGEHKRKLERIIKSIEHSGVNDTQG